jgi:hypothetical protein
MHKSDWPTAICEKHRCPKTVFSEVTGQRVCAVCDKETVRETRIEDTPTHSFLIQYYRLMYHRNPEGALEFHIDRLIRQGKTRRDAMLELEDEMKHDRQ